MDQGSLHVQYRVGGGGNNFAVTTETGPEHSPQPMNMPYGGAMCSPVGHSRSQSPPCRERAMEGSPCSTYTEECRHRSLPC
jgi:hypothetical protein